MLFGLQTVKMAESETVNVSSENKESNRNLEGSGEKPSIDDEEEDDDDDDGDGQEAFTEGSGSGDRELIITNDAKTPVDKKPNNENEDFFFAPNRTAIVKPASATTEGSTIVVESTPDVGSKTPPSLAVIHLPECLIVLLTVLLSVLSSTSCVSLL